jgi:hypothetical protein
LKPTQERQKNNNTFWFFLLVPPPWAVFLYVRLVFGSICAQLSKVCVEERPFGVAVWLGGEGESAGERKRKWRLLNRFQFQKSHTAPPKEKL